MKYFKLFNEYYAIDELKNKVFRCRNLLLICRIELYPIGYLDFIDHPLIQEITAAEFQEQFSKVVEFFHNETPFA